MEKELNSLSARPASIRQIGILIKRILRFEPAQNLFPEVFKRYKDIVPKIQLLQDYMGVHENVPIVALYLIDRVTEKNQFYLSKSNLYNLLLVGIMIAIKLHQDLVYEISSYLSLMETPVYLYIELERQFLALIDFDLHIDEDSFLKYKNRLMTLENR